MNNKKPFKHLKNALMIIASNHSAIMQQISRSKNYRSIENPFITQRPTSYGIGSGLTVSFDVMVKNDFLPELSYSKKGQNFVIVYNDFTYSFTDTNITVHQKMGVPNIHVDISDIESSTDMFSLSTLRDFYDLNYTDVEALQHLMKESTKNYNGILKHV